MAKLQADLNKHEREDKKKAEEYKKRENMLKAKDEEIKKYKELIQIHIGGDESKKRENSQLLHGGNDAKTSRQSESILKNDYEWNVPSQMPKKNAKIWICPVKGEDPKEATVTGYKGKDVFVAMVNKTKASLDIDLKVHLWSNQKPIYIKTPDSSAILGASASTPKHTPEEVKGGGILKLIGK